MKRREFLEMAAKGALGATVLGLVGCGGDVVPATQVPDAASVPDETTPSIKLTETPVVTEIPAPIIDRLRISEGIGENWEEVTDPDLLFLEGIVGGQFQNIIIQTDYTGKALKLGNATLIGDRLYTVEHVATESDGLTSNCVVSRTSENKVVIKRIPLVAWERIDGTNNHDDIISAPAENLGLFDTPYYFHHDDDSAVVSSPSYVVMHTNQTGVQTDRVNGLPDALVLLPGDIPVQIFGHTDNTYIAFGETRGNSVPLLWSGTSGQVVTRGDYGVVGFYSGHPDPSIVRSQKANDGADLLIDFQRATFEPPKVYSNPKIGTGSNVAILSLIRPLKVIN